MPDLWPALAGQLIGQLVAGLVLIAIVTKCSDERPAPAGPMPCARTTKSADATCTARTVQYLSAAHQR